MYDTSDIRKGLKVLMDGNPYTVVEFQFVKPGKGAAFTRTKMKNLLSGGVIERNLRSPLAGITQAAARLGLSQPDVTVAMRSGDTPADERRAFARHRHSQHGRDTRACAQSRPRAR